VVGDLGEIKEVHVGGIGEGQNQARPTRGHCADSRAAELVAEGVAAYAGRFEEEVLEGGEVAQVHIAVGAIALGIVDVREIAKCTPCPRDLPRLPRPAKKVGALFGQAFPYDGNPTNPGTLCCRSPRWRARVFRRIARNRMRSCGSCPRSR
jgi:hypothetical protein